jgi:transcriptional regulator with XRE-family HTH domain
MKAFARAVVTLRKKARYTQKAFAEAIGYSQSHWNRVEKGQRTPPPREKVILITGLLDLDEDERNSLLMLAGYSPEPLTNKFDQVKYSSLVSRAATSKSDNRPETRQETQGEAQRSPKSKSAELLTRIFEDSSVPSESKVDLDNEVFRFIEWNLEKMRRKS